MSKPSAPPKCMNQPATPRGKSFSESKRRLLEKLMRGSTSQSHSASDPVARRPPDEPAPLGLAQEQVWRRSFRAADKPPLYNEVVTVYREGPLDDSDNFVVQWRLISGSE